MVVSILSALQHHHPEKRHDRSIYYYPPSVRYRKVRAHEDRRVQDCLSVHGLRHELAADAGRLLRFLLVRTRCRVRLSRRSAAGKRAPPVAVAGSACNEDVGDWRCHVDAAQSLACDRGCGFFVAASDCLGRLAARKAARCPPLARLWFPARLSSAAQQQRSNVSFEGINPQHSGFCAKLLVWRRSVLLRRTALFPRPLEWRQFRSVLDLYAYRTDVELRVTLS